MLFTQQYSDAWNDGVVRARQDREADAVHVFLNGGGNNHLWRLPQSGIDDLHAGIAKSAGDNLRAAVMPVKSRFGYKDTNWRETLH